jgi:hypothetical protein
MIGGWTFKQMGMSEVSGRVATGPTAEAIVAASVCILGQFLTEFLTDSSCQGSLRGEIMV